MARCIYLPSAWYNYPVIGYVTPFWWDWLQPLWYADTMGLGPFLIPHPPVAACTVGIVLLLFSHRTRLSSCKPVSPLHAPFGHVNIDVSRDTHCRSFSFVVGLFLAARDRTTPIIRSRMRIATTGRVCPLWVCTSFQQIGSSRCVAPNFLVACNVFRFVVE